MLADGTGGTLTAVAVVLLAYGCLFGAGELARRRGVPGETTRTGVHVLSSLVGLLLPCLFSSPRPVLVLGLVFACGMAATRGLGTLGSVHDVRRHTIGAQLYPIGVAAAFALTGGHAPAYPIAILTLGLGDPAASLVGRRLGRRRLTVCGTQRSVEGSTAACLVSASIAAIVLAATGDPGPTPLLLAAATVGLAVALAEALSPGGLDNLTIPIVAAAVVHASLLPWGLAVVPLVLADLVILSGAWSAWRALRSSRIGGLRWRA